MLVSFSPLNIRKKILSQFTKCFPCKIRCHFSHKKGFLCVYAYIKAYIPINDLPETPTSIQANFLHNSKVPHRNPIYRKRASTSEEQHLGVKSTCPNRRNSIVLELSPSRPFGTWYRRYLVSFEFVS